MMEAALNVGSLHIGALSNLQDVEVHLHIYLLEKFLIYYDAKILRKT